jgi:hypothetical protein
MKLRLVLKTITNKDKEVSIKFNIAPSQHIGFINFLNLCMNQENPVKVSFEKISKSGEKEQSKVAGTFTFEAQNETELKELKREVEKKRQQK